MTTGQVARELRTSVPRVHRSVKALGLAPERTAGGHLRLTPSEVRALRQALGIRPSIAGLTWQDTLVLAVLSRHPLGLVSARAVALRAGISPTTAARALRRLSQAGYIEQVERDVAEGHVRRISLWQVRYSSPRWLEVAAEVGEVDLPEVPRVQPAETLPRRLAHLFWSMPPPRAIRLEENAATIAYRILVSHDPEALSWAATHLPPSALRRAARFRNVDPRSAALAQNLAAAR